MSYSQKVKERAYQIDPGAWISYSGKPKHEKAYMDSRRTAALDRASQEFKEQKPRNRDIQPDPTFVISEILDWWDGLPANLRQGIEGSDAEPGCIARARKVVE